MSIKGNCNGVSDYDQIYDVCPPPPGGAHIIGEAAYRELYAFSMENNDAYWKSVADELYFETRSDKYLEYNFDIRKGEIFTKFMDGARTNMAYNCLERNVEKGLGDKIAYFWEGNEPSDTATITYKELLDKVVNFSAVLRAHGVKKGDTVIIYMPMVFEIGIAMLACARIGATHGTVFAGFSPDSLSSRILDANAHVIVTADGYYKYNCANPLKPIVDTAVEMVKAKGGEVTSVIVLRHFERVTRPAGAVRPEPGPKMAIDYDFYDEMKKYSGTPSPVEWMDSEAPLFVLYTSGSTGVPKGLVHCTGGYMVHVYLMMKLVFNAQPDDVYFCTGDCGWLTGHSCLIYGPLLNGMTSVWHEGAPNYPTPARYWELVDKYKVNKMYSFPTAMRALKAHGNKWLKSTTRATLQMMGNCAEPLNPASFKWLREDVGQGHCIILNTYWQTESGAPILGPLPYASKIKPGICGLPYFGISPVILNSDSEKVDLGDGDLCFDMPWPGMVRTILGNHKRYVDTYFIQHPGYCTTGDGGHIDADGHIRITGRVDDVLNVCGHLLPTVEMENAIVAHSKVAEAAVVGAKHQIKGEVPYVFVTMSVGEELTPELIDELKDLVKERVGAFAVPDAVQEVKLMPKTRTGKITRRILKKIVAGEFENFGDLSALLDATIIDTLIQERQNRTKIAAVA